MTIIGDANIVSRTRVIVKQKSRIAVQTWCNATKKARDEINRASTKISQISVSAMKLGNSKIENMKSL